MPPVATATTEQRMFKSKEGRIVDRAIPRSFRFMEGFGVHTFRLINAKNESTFVKFHWKPKLGMQSVLWNEAVKINGADTDFHRRDLWTAIQTGSFPEWELQFQLFDQEFADSFEFDLLDPTKLIPEELVPPVPSVAWYWTGCRTIFSLKPSKLRS
jgi:catalase